MSIFGKMSLPNFLKKLFFKLSFPCHSNFPTFVLSAFCHLVHRHFPHFSHSSNSTLFFTMTVFTAARSSFFRAIAFTAVSQSTTVPEHCRHCCWSSGLFLAFFAALCCWTLPADLASLEEFDISPLCGAAQLSGEPDGDALPSRLWLGTFECHWGDMPSFGDVELPYIGHEPPS